MDPVFRFRTNDPKHKSDSEENIESTFLNHFMLKQLKIMHNGQFCNRSGSDSLEMGNFG